jgi:stage II sporulation protein GA (sporulation sigma-E factor processing peptidase)
MVEVYLDVPFVGAFYSLIQDSALLWMVAQITALRPRILRLVAGGLIGGTFQFFLLLNQSSGGLVDSWILSPVVFSLVPPLMLGVTFCPIGLRKFWQIGGYFYLLAFLLAGINWGIDEFNHRFLGWPFSFAWRFLLHLTLLFSLGELGWGIIHRKVWERVCLFPLRVCWETRQLETQALLDTGNRLSDPLTKAPVIILELAEIKRYLPAEVLAAVAKMARGELEQDTAISTYWQERFRLLPFGTIGPEDGLMVGFRPEEVVINQNGQLFRHRNVVVALCNRRLSPEGNFHALIAPDLLTEY